jgi:hypothetical protein
MGLGILRIQPRNIALYSIKRIASLLVTQRFQGLGEQEAYSVSQLRLYSTQLLAHYLRRLSNYAILYD